MKAEPPGLAVNLPGRISVSLFSRREVVVLALSITGSLFSHLSIFLVIKDGRTVTDALKNSG